MPAEKSMDFGLRPSGCSACCGRERPLIVRGARCSASSASTLSVLGPKHPRPRHRPHLRRRHRPAAAGRRHQGSRRSTQLRRAGQTTRSPTCCRGDGRRARARASTSTAVGARAAAGRWSSTSCASLFSLAAGPADHRRRAAHRLPAARATSRPSSPGCRCATSTGSRAASCSAGSPTTSTTSRRPCSRR